ncbi:MAG: hypothetical protein Q8R70_01265, partial [Methanoregula sp.]|nr:hypothetical protein [Methanoregula sp.]
TTQSEIRSLTVIPVDSVTSLTVNKANSKGEVVCTGSVNANRPVRTAPVELIVDGSRVTSTTTDKNGNFRATLRLSHGEHMVVARFSDEGYPIRRSESKPQTVQVAIVPLVAIMPEISILPLFVAFLILFSFAGGSWYYLKRMQGRGYTAPPATPVPDLSDATAPLRIPDMDAAPQSDSVKDAASTEDTAGESLFIRYSHILQEQGLNVAARVVYLGLSGRIAQELQLQRHTCLTPRELSRTCTKKPYCRSFSSFVHVYERIRYGGYRSAAVQTAFETEMKNTATDLGSDDH